MYGTGGYSWRQAEAAKLGIWSRLVRTIAPASPVITLAQAKAHLRVDFNDDDDLITGLVEAATAAIEGPAGIGIALMPQTWRLSLDWFPYPEIIIPLGPVTSIVSIAYTDSTGSPASVSTWRADTDSNPCRIWPARDTSWPLIMWEPGAIKVTFQCGYAVVPSDIKAAVKVMVCHLYEHRESVTELNVNELPMGVDSILNRYRVGRVA
jgi:uncharacterized phiE125 gp8 family phage protein